MWRTTTSCSRQRSSGPGAAEDFGKAWDRNLTDADGPYIELMTGVYHR